MKDASVSLCVRYQVTAMVVVGFAIATLAGCGPTIQEQKLRPGVHPGSDVAVTREHLRLRMRGLVGPMCGEVEATADAITAARVEPAVRRYALGWKLAAVPALRASLFQPDPLTAVGDTWVLLFQMADLFATGAGRDALGPSSADAAAACRRMEGDFSRVVASFTQSGDVSRLQALAKDYAASHPLRHSIADREPVPGDAFGRELATSLSVGEAVAEMSDLVDDLSRKLEAYSDQMPRQGRWQAQLFTGELAAGLPTERALTLTERALTAAERVAGAGERLAPAIEDLSGRAPDILSAERIAAIRALHDELQTSQTFLQAERIQALQTLSAERAASMRELREMVVAEHAAMTRDVEQVTTRVVDHAMARLERLVGEVSVAMTVAALVLLLAVRALFRRPAEGRHT